MSQARQWTAAEDEAINTARDRGEPLRACAERLGIAHSTVNGRRGFLLRWGKDEARPEKRIVEVTCYCCRKKWKTDQLDVRKCPRCKKLGHEIECHGSL